MGNSRQYTSNFIRVHKKLRRINAINRIKRIAFKILKLPLAIIKTIIKELYD